MIISSDEKKLIFVTAIFFFFVHTMCLSGFQVPDQGLNFGHGSESSESPPLDLQGTPKSFILKHIQNQKFFLKALLLWIE